MWPPAHCVPHLWCRIRKTTLEGTPVSVIGEDVDLTYPTNYLGAGADALDKALKDEKFMEGFKKAKHPMVIVGPGILKRADRGAVLAKVGNIGRAEWPVPCPSGQLQRLP